MARLLRMTQGAITGERKEPSQWLKELLAYVAQLRMLVQVGAPVLRRKTVMESRALGCSGVSPTVTTITCAPVL